LPWPNLRPTQNRPLLFCSTCYSTRSRSKARDAQAKGGDAQAKGGDAKAKEGELKNQMYLVKVLVIKHMHPDMLYKLNIDKQ
jgi:hypothetical protein